MKIFLDTNILLDLLLEREKVKEAMIILNSIDRGVYEGVILDITLINIDYISRKQQVDAKDFLKLLVQDCKVIGADNNLSIEALNLDNSDFEDSLQYVCAKNSGCEYIISNDKSFYRGEIEVLSSSEFVNKLFLFSYILLL
jgi:predicted nucleic acid-binding protein